MKTKLPFFILILFFFNSCANRFHVYEIESEEVIKNKEDLFVFENDDLAIVYDFWTNGGEMIFNIYNKRDSVLYLKMDESEFWINGIGYQYYEKAENWPFDGREERSSGPKSINIAPHSKETVNGFPVGYQLLKYRSGEKYKSFYKSDSPFVFENRLTYSFDQIHSEKAKLENEFWVSNAKRMKRKDFKLFEEGLEHSKSDKFFVFKQGLPPNFWLDLTLETLQASLQFF